MHLIRRSANKIIDIYIYRFIMEIFKQDSILEQISSEISEEHNILLEQMNKIIDRKDKNKYLKEIFNDYNLYYENLVQIKQKQQENISYILDYLEEELLSDKYDDGVIKHINYQINLLTKKLECTKKDLEKLNTVNTKK